MFPSHYSYAGECFFLRLKLGNFIKTIAPRQNSSLDRPSLGDFACENSFHSLSSFQILYFCEKFASPYGEYFY